MRCLFIPGSHNVYTLSLIHTYMDIYIYIYTEHNDTHQTEKPYKFSGSSQMSASIYLARAMD